MMMLLKERFVILRLEPGAMQLCGSFQIRPFLYNQSLNSTMSLNYFSLWETSSPRPLPGLCPWTPLGDGTPDAVDYGGTKDGQNENSWCRPWLEQFDGQCSRDPPTSLYPCHRNSKYMITLMTHSNSDTGGQEQYDSLAVESQQVTPTATATKQSHTYKR